MVYEGGCIAEINSVEEYLKFLKNYKENNNREVWYRGQLSNRWSLSPNLYRNAERITSGGGRVELLRYNFVNFKAEFSKLKEEISKNKLLDISKLNDFQIMFIAQHYGLLTPILDWTTDPLVALFFALDGNLTYDDDEFPVIYIIKPGLCNENSVIGYDEGKVRIKNPICIDSDSSNKLFNLIVTDNLNNSPANDVPISVFSKVDFSYRISRQSGKFTIHGPVGPLNYEWNNRTSGDEKFVDAIKINTGAIYEIKEYLKVLNINKKTIYRIISTPLDIICNNIKEQELGIFKNKIANINEVFLKDEE